MLNTAERTAPAQNVALAKALFLLSRPASLAAMAVLLLNDHLLRRLWPSWWTGKLGDFAWLYFMPFAAAAVLALVLPRKLGRREDLAGWLAFATIGGVFSLAKTLPFFHAWLVGNLEAVLGFPVGWQRDPTDLIALVSLAAAWMAWRRALKPLSGGIQREAGFKNFEVEFNHHPGPAMPPLNPPRKNGGEVCSLPRSYGGGQGGGSLGWIALPLAALLTIANGPAPNTGIACLEIQDQHILASSNYLGFVSTDGGLSWQPSEEQRCQFHNQAADSSDVGAARPVISDPANKDVQYRFKPGSAIERSDDAGQTWRAEFNPTSPGQADRLYMEKTHTGTAMFHPGPLDALVDPNTGNAIFAMGFEGILVRKANGEWVWAAAGDYRHTTPLQITQPSAVFGFLSGELVLAVMLGLLLVCTLSIRVNRHRLRLLVLGLAWLVWIIAATVIPPSLAQGYAIPVSSLFSLLAVVLVVPFSLESLFRIGRDSPRWLLALAGAVLVAISGALLFFLPYILWALNGLPDYYMAVGFGSVLAVATLVVGYWRTHRLIVKKQRADPGVRPQEAL
jgi:hypothetical protein